MPQNKAPAEFTAQILKAILDNTVDGLIVINETGKVLSYNRACENIFGYPAETVIGQNVSMLMPAPTRKEHDIYLEDYKRTGEARIIGIGREVEGRHQSGELVPLDLSVARVEVAGETLYSGIVRDISIRKQAEERLAASRAELERFAHIASHDLKEPLRTIEAFSEILLSEHQAGLNEDGQEYLGFIMDASKRMNRLISDILDHARLDSLDANVETFDSSVPVREVLEFLAEAIKNADAEVVIGDLPVITLNPVRFARVVQNLVSNAIKYRDISRPLSIKIETELVSNEWVFSVIDNGIGIDNAHKDQVFDMFRRLQPMTPNSGTGIGLSVCRKLVKSWNGRISVDSVRGEGSRFSFTVPFLQD